MLRTFKYLKSNLINLSVGHDKEISFCLVTQFIYLSTGFLITFK